MLDNQMFIPKPIENRDTCFICGRKAETVEHVIPKWLQHRYNLWDEHLLLPNKTSIPYRNVLVPSCAKCNNEVYGSLENRVSSGIATESDIWKWANKIHYALGYKDRFLAWDRANPNYKIGDIISSNDPIERDRHFLHCVSGDFHTDPDPFGSVFKFEFAKFSEFAFAHIIHSQSISVCLSNIGYVIFVTDGQALKRDVGLTQYYNSFPKPVKREETKSSPHFEWQAPSFYYNPQKKYLALVVIALMAGAVALLFFDRDMLLAIFLMLSSLVLVLYTNKKPDMSKISVDQTGISINDRVYYYKELKSFWIDYNPHGPKELSLEARKWYLPHIKVSLEQEDPIELRSLMINFVPERVHEQSLVDFIARKLGL